MHNNIVRAVAAAAMTTLALTACSNTQKDSESKVDTATAAAEASKSSHAHTATSAVQLTDGYVKAKPTEKTMTGIFGTLRNTSAQPVTLTGFSTNTGAGEHEIHEVKDGVMQMKQGGITLPAGGTYELKPGGDHLMVMDLAKEIAAGDTVTVTLQLDGADDVTLDVPVRTIASGQENYGANGGVQGNSGVTEDPHAHHHG